MPDEGRTKQNASTHKVLPADEVRAFKVRLMQEVTRLYRRLTNPKHRGDATIKISTVDGRSPKVEITVRQCGFGPDDYTLGEIPPDEST